MIPSTAKALALASSGSGALAVRTNTAGQSVHVVLDVVGYFQ